MKAIERNLKDAGKTHREGKKERSKDLGQKRRRREEPKRMKKKKEKRDYLGRGESEGGREKPVVI